MLDAGGVAAMSGEVVLLGWLEDGGACFMCIWRGECS